MGFLSQVANSALDNLITERYPYVLRSNEQLSSIDTQGALSVIRSGNVFQFMPNDMSSVDDGVNVLVDQSGRRYRSQLSGEIISVIDILSTPPTSPNNGDAGGLFC